MKQLILRDLGAGLVLRRATIEDTDALIAFNCDIHCGSDPPAVRQSMAQWIRELMSGNHPTVRAGDFTIVEDTNTGAIASSLCLISQTWSYDGIRFAAGQVELVGTMPDSRRRGLVRAQFEVIHEWSAQRRQMVQAILGIPNFYRQFGYEMGLEAHGGRMGDRRDVPDLPKGAREPYRVRRATEADIPFIAQTYRGGRNRYLVTCAWTNALWRYELTRRNQGAMGRRRICVIHNAKDGRVGILAHPSCLWDGLWDGGLGAFAYELKPGVSWLAVTPSVMRYLLAKGEEYAARDKKELGSVGFALGSEHPAYQVMPSRLPRTREPYAFYVRMPDLPSFVRRIAPVLERRLAESVAVGYTGELRLDFYRDGLRMAFDRGRLTQVERWQRGEGRSAALPDLTFLQLLFGHRSLDELHLAYRDLFASGDEARLLLNVLFPKKPSAVWTLT